MYGLQDHGLGDQIAADRQALNDKFAKGESDPCFEVETVINIAALQFFTPQVLLTSFGGCPICAFNNVLDRVIDQIAIKYKKVH